MKTILITAGGTSEPIDNIRSITNTGTGALGSEIAEAFAKYPEIKRILYVHGHRSILPKTEKAECIEAPDTRSLQKTIRRLLKKYHVDAIIHSMAVSDYSVGAVVKAEDLERITREAEDAQYSAVRGMNLSSVIEAAKAGLDSEDLLTAAQKYDLRDVYNKIPSSAGNPVIFLEPTPKIIPELRQLEPEAIIVGFPLLDEVEHSELMSVAEKLMTKNDCDFVLANDYQTVQAGAAQHVGHLMARDGSVETFTGKPAIAEGIAAAVSKLWK